MDEYERRYARAIALMERHGVDALMVTQEENVRYFTGCLSILWISKFRPYLALLPRDLALGATLFAPTQERGNIEETSWVSDHYLFPDQENPIPHLVGILRDKGLSQGVIATELGFGMRLGMNIQQFDELRGSGPPGWFVDGTPLIQALRMIKSDREVARMRKACEISQIGTRAGWEALRPGITERELAAIICSAMFAAGAEVGTHPSFFGLGAGPDRYKLGANAFPSDYVLQEGDLVIMDGGAVYGGYVTDYIRQACVGQPTAEQMRYFEIAREANDVAIHAIRPGVTGADVYEAAMAVFDRREVRQFSHHNIVGHGLGMDVHEVPWLGERGKVYTSSTILQAGMVLSVEPVFARANDPDRRKGTWIQEDVVLVTPAGHEVLTDGLSKELWVQERSGEAH